MSIEPDESLSPDEAARVEGQVVDESVAPIEGVAVRAADQERITDASGSFVFEALPPGPLVLSAFHIGYMPFEQEFVLVVGQTVNLTLTLKGAPSGNPFVRTVQENGFLACSISGSIYLDENTCPDALQSNQKDRFLVPFNRSGLHEVLVELVWTSNLPGGTGALLGHLSLHLTEPDGRTIMGRRGYGHIRISSPPDAIVPTGERTEPTVHARVWPAAQNADGDPGGVAYQQPISLYFSFAYGRTFEPDETFRT